MSTTYIDVYKNDSGVYDPCKDKFELYDDLADIPEGGTVVTVGNEGPLHTFVVSQLDQEEGYCHHCALNRLEGSLYSMCLAWRCTGGRVLVSVDDMVESL